MDPVTALVGIGITVVGGLISWFGGIEENQHQQDMLEQQMQDLREMYGLQVEAYNDAVDQAHEGYALSIEHVTEEATTRMEGLRRDRDNIVEGTTTKTELAGRDLLGKSVQGALEGGKEGAGIGFSGVAMSGSTQGVMEQNADMREYQLDSGTIALDLQRDMGYYGAAKNEYGALNTEDALNRSIGSLDLQLGHNLENLSNSKDMLDLNFSNNMGMMSEQLDWLERNQIWGSVAGALDLAGIGVTFAQMDYEYDLGYFNWNNPAPTSNGLGG